VIKRISLIRRKPGMTPEEFWEHYTGPHAGIAQKLPGVCKMALSRVVGPQPVEWDAVGELWFDDAAAVEKAFADPEIAGLLAQDRPLFLGHSEVIIAEETVFWSADT
jgi:uncharacterized protein (TIGR02118 family)